MADETQRAVDLFGGGVALVPGGVAVREEEPEGVSVSVGAEIGEVGMKNSTVEELHAFMQGYNQAIAGLGRGIH